MSRSDGSFPVYNKLDLDKDHPRKDWDEGCRRCIQCGKSWPNISSFSPSPCCSVAAGTVGNMSPDMSWKEAVIALHTSRFERIYSVWNEDMSDEQLSWIPDSEADPISEQDIIDGLEEIDQLIANIGEESVQPSGSKTR